MRRVLLTCVWLAGGAAVLSASQTAAPDGLVDRAAAYVLDYQQQLTAVVADERYTQHVRLQVPRDTGMPARRTTLSEIFFLHVPGHDWMAMRDVMTSDGYPVPNRPDLKAALRRLDAPEVARQFKTYNSRFNLGRVVRNFNEPTIGLLVLDPTHRGRFTFTRRRDVRIKGQTLAVLGFLETRRPTLVSNTDGSSVFSSGEITVEPSTGRVRRTLLALTIGSIAMTLSTDYEQDERLGMLVPATFRERYQNSRVEDIVCEASYENFRRFEVQTRIR